MKKKLINYLGLLGVASFVSYAVAVIFSPMAYPGYNWLSQAVSDLSASDAPSLDLWNKLSSVYSVCEVLCAVVVCIAIQNKQSKLLKIGVYLFAIMEFISAVGYKMFPLSTSGYAGSFQDVMHLIITALVVMLSIASLVLIMIAGCRNKQYKSYAIFATIALGMMLVGALGMKIVPVEYFGVVERFSVFSATGFNAVLGIHLFLDKNASSTVASCKDSQSENIYHI